MRSSPVRHDGVCLCARYALPTTQRRFCGPFAAPDVLWNLLLAGEGREQAIKALQTFEALYPYLDLIADVKGRQPFDAEVVESYWIGNEMLEGRWRDVYPHVLRRLAGRGLPRSFASRLRENLPSDPIPHHTFHVLFVGVGAVTGHVPTTIANMDRCRISWGVVEGIGEGRLQVKGPVLEWVDDAFQLESEHTMEVQREPMILPNVAQGDVVAIHWETAVDRLNGPRLNDLRKYTRRALKSANEVASRDKDLVKL